MLNIPDVAALGLWEMVIPSDWHKYWFPRSYPTYDEAVLALEDLAETFYANQLPTGKNPKETREISER